MPGRGVTNGRHLAIVRRAYARQMLARGGVSHNPGLEDALASVPRERFVGRPPWRISHGGGVYSGLSSDDPVVLYQDVLVALDPGRGVNNGSPSLHALWIDRLAPQPGERVVHIGAGTGYYSEILARLVGPDGHVDAVEFDPALAELATANLAEDGNVTVIHGDGADWPRGPADCIYVNFAVTRPAMAWLDRLAPGGRLIFPLGLPKAMLGRGRGWQALQGASFLVERRSGGFAASWLGEAFFVCAEGALASSEEDRAALAAAFEQDDARNGARLVRSLGPSGSAPPERCWLRGEGWCLSYDDVPPSA